MRKVLVPLCLLALCLPIAAQDASEQMKDFTRVLNGDGLKLSLLQLNEVTLPLAFQPPTLYAVRARTKDNTLFYVQGTADKALKLDTTSFTIDQNGESTVATPMNIKHFEKGTEVAVPKGEKVDGILVFGKVIDLAQPFTVKHGKDSVKFELSKDAVKKLAPKPAN